ncbi:MAG TPA: HAD-IIIC family phosphatase [Acetobacteraceae bacterium]
MLLRRSSFVHLLPLNDSITLSIHAVTQLRVTVTPQVAELIAWFDEPRELEAALPILAAQFGYEEATLRSCIAMLLDRGILTDRTPEEEHDAVARELRPVHGRDPTELLDRYRRACLEGSHPYWAVDRPRGLDDAVGLRHRRDVLMFGDCDVQMETDFLRREATARGIDLRVAASFSGDVGLAREWRHDAVIIGALQARHAIVLGEPRHHNGDPAQVYVETMRRMLERLRAVTAAPILIDGLPEPTVQPLGFADWGEHSHRNRFRRTNLALERMAQEFADVYVMDVASALAAAGAATLLDDGLISFTHFGSQGWMLQRPNSELAAVHGQFPDMQSLAAAVAGDPYRRETVMARAHMDALVVLLGLDRKKCVIVDLDGVLWPGVLAETGSPFAWSPDISSPNSYVGLYFGIHEALCALRQRGILLACVSKNDEATVRELWRYPPHYPHHRLLTPDSFVTWRINWEDKAANIGSIIEELGFSPDSFMFIDDSTRERERVRQSLPDITVLGDDLFALRRTLLTDPRLQPPHLTAESPRRTELVRAQLERSRLRTEIPDETAFLDSLEIVCTVERVMPPDAPPVMPGEGRASTSSAAALDNSHTQSGPAAILKRISELLDRTTQFNATGRKFALAELNALIQSSRGRVFILHVRDRLADHGLTGAAIVDGNEILNFVLSCRVIGLGAERALLDGIMADAAPQSVRGRIIETGRNIPARNLFRDHGFTDRGDGRWVMAPSPGHATPDEQGFIPDRIENDSSCRRCPE